MAHASPLTTSAQRRYVAALGALLLSLAPSIAHAATSSPFNPVSPGASAISGLFWFLLIVAGLIFVGVEGALLFASFRFRERPGQAPATFHGNRILEIVWTALPILLLGVIFYLTVRTMAAATAAGGSDPIDVNAIGHQWWWEFDYPQEQITTAGELHVPVGQTIIVHVHSADVIHSFWVPQLAGKMDANPGFSNTVTFTPSAAGQYDVICAELCGVEHAWMRALVVVDSPADYAAWVKQQRTPAPAPSGPAVRGEQIYQSQSCAACHQNGAGPDLGHVGLRRIIGGGVLTNTTENMARWLADPQAVKPGTKMPNYHFTTDELTAITAYLESRR